MSGAFRVIGRPNTTFPLSREQDQKLRQLRIEARWIFRAEIKERYASKPLPPDNAIDDLVTTLKKACAAQWARPVPMAKARVAIGILVDELPSLIELTAGRGAPHLASCYAELLKSALAAAKAGGGRVRKGAPAIPRIESRRTQRATFKMVERVLLDAGWESVGKGNHSPAIVITTRLLTELFDVPCNDEAVRKTLKDVPDPPRGEYWLDRKAAAPADGAAPGDAKRREAPP